ncbi:hypothetical protein JCM6882_001404 [Rhodosporidiobolus microsporus]
MDTVVLPAEPSDWTRLVDIESAAFGPDDPLVSLCFSGVTREANHAFAPKRFQWALRNPQTRIVKAVRGGEVIGWALWEVPLGEGEEAFNPGEGEGPGFPEGTNMEEIAAFFPKLDMGVEEPHYYLSVLVVDPKKQRTGAARLLLQWGLDQADADGKEVYLQSSLDARAVYAKFGFFAFGPPVVGGTQDQLVAYPMRRLARKRRSPASALPPPVPSTNGSPSTAAPSSTSEPLVDVLPATAADLESLVTIQRLSFASSAITRLIFPGISPASHRAQWIKRLQKALDHPYRAVYKAVLKETGENVGMAVWELPRPVDAPKEEEEKREWPEGANVELATEYFGRLHFDPGCPNYHLTILVVDPSKQRSGAGAALLDWGCKKADEKGVPMYLEATDVGLPLYAKYGFKTDRPAITGGPNEEIILHPMSRAARLPAVATPRDRIAVLPAELSDFPLLASIRRRAFDSSPLNPYLFPNVSDAAYEAHSVQQFERWHKSDKEEMVKAVSTATGEVVGLAVWALPVSERDSAPEAVEHGGEGEKQVGEGKTEEDAPSWPEGTNTDWADKFFSSLDSFQPKERHLGLHLIVVDPEKQRLGAGSALFRWGCKRADREGVPIYLEATEDGARLYERHGLSKFRPPVKSSMMAEYVMYPMHRPALTVSPLGRSEIPLLPRIYRLSFQASTIMNYAWPNLPTEAFVPWVTARMEGTLAARETGDKGDTLVAKRGGEVVGYAWFSYYPRVEEREKATGEKKARVLPEGANVERANRFLDALEAHKATIPEAHYSLDNLCVLPEAQRSGVGKALTVALLEKARRDGVSVTLESMEGGLPLYTHLGFKPFAQPLRMPDCPEVDLVVPMRWTPEKQ